MLVGPKPIAKCRTYASIESLTKPNHCSCFLEVSSAQLTHNAIHSLTDFSVSELCSITHSSTHSSHLGLPTSQKPLAIKPPPLVIILDDSFIQNRIASVYPKVKVRTDGRDDQHAHDWSSLLSLKDIQFLCLQDSCVPVKGHQDVSPPIVARIPKSYVPNVIMPKVSVSEEAGKKSNSTEEDRLNIRASSIPRPRAVLSSPDNDAVIGSNNWTKVARPTASKNNKADGK
ncbi:hypothetical protein NC652_025108 [Populus alba x Populus x berolinensis]|nr:hypothetical protein NC652_025108 [Populus alba x Populus x berolinensis]